MRSDRIFWGAWALAWRGGNPAIFSSAKSQGKTYAEGDRSQRDFADSSIAGRRR
jgi:hypothetical protein